MITSHENREYNFYCLQQKWGIFLVLIFHIILFFHHYFLPQALVFIHQFDDKSNDAKAMDSQDLLKISADNEIHKKHKKRTKKMKAQLQEQVCDLFYKISLRFFFQVVLFFEAVRGIMWNLYMYVFSSVSNRLSFTLVMQTSRRIVS